MWQTMLTHFSKLVGALVPQVININWWDIITGQSLLQWMFSSGAQGPQGPQPIQLRIWHTWSWCCSSSLFCSGPCTTGEHTKSRNGRPTSTACGRDTNKVLGLISETSCLSGFVAASALMQWQVWRRNGALLKDICWVWVWMLQNKPWRTGMRVCTQPLGNCQHMLQFLDQVHVGEGSRSHGNMFRTCQRRTSCLICTDGPTLVCCRWVCFVQCLWTTKGTRASAN